MRIKPWGSGRNPKLGRKTYEERMKSLHDYTEIAKMLGFSYKPSFVYWHTDYQGHLLYVGLSDMIHSRTKSHRDRSPWFSYVANVTINESYPCRRFAAIAECEDIYHNHPIFNTQRVKPKEPSYGRLMTLADFRKMVYTYNSFGHRGIPDLVDIGMSSPVARKFIPLMDWYHETYYDPINGAH